MKSTIRLLRTTSADGVHSNCPIRAPSTALWLVTSGTHHPAEPGSPTRGRVGRSSDPHTGGGTLRCQSIPANEGELDASPPECCAVADPRPAHLCRGGLLSDQARRRHLPVGHSLGCR